MSIRAWTALSILIVLLASISYLTFAVVGHGFSAREKPSKAEEFIARRMRRLAIPRDALQLTNPYSLAPESVNAAGEHWSEHCSMCHGSDGTGRTTLGGSLYPPAPDLKSARVQELSDGELFYIISNGIRFTGMPAWAGSDSPEEIWRLVTFIRALPTLTRQELGIIGPQNSPSRDVTGEAENRSH